MIKPKKLKKGDKVAIVSLSSGIMGEEFCKHQVEIGVKRLNDLGLTPIFMKNALKGIDFIKNNPKARAEDLKDAFLDDSIKGIICAIGGDDTYKIMPYLMVDEVFKKIVIEKPKIFIGFSDTTNNHIMLNQLGLITYYGLNFLSDISELDISMLDYTKNSYLRLFENEEAFEIKPSEYWYLNREKFDISEIGKPLVKIKENKYYEFLNCSDSIKGILWGGCLESIYDIFSSQRYIDQRSIYEKFHLIPTKDFFKDKILFLEASEEKPNPSNFRHMIEYLSNEGIFENIKGILFGKPYDEVYYDEYKKIISELNMPTVFNMNFGHALPRALIPYGVEVLVDFKLKSVKIIEKIFEE